MIELHCNWLLFHGLIVMLVGVLSGIPFWLAIIKDKGKEKINAWRVAHSFLIVYAILMLIFGLMLQYLTLHSSAAWLIEWSLVVAGYSFIVAFTVGAWKGHRGLLPKPYGLNTILFVSHTIGVIGSLVGIVTIIYSIIKNF